MTRHDITRMAWEAGLIWKEGLSGWGWHINHPDDLKRFYDRAVAAEREACAQMVMPLDESLADEIRARGEKK